MEGRMNSERVREGGREGLPSAAVHLALAVVPRGGQRNDSTNKRVSGSRHTSCTSIPSSCVWLQKRFIVLHQGTWGATAVPFLAPGEMKRSPKMLPRSFSLTQGPTRVRPEPAGRTPRRPRPLAERRLAAWPPRSAAPLWQMSFSEALHCGAQGRKRCHRGTRVSPVPFPEGKRGRGRAGSAGRLPWPPCGREDSAGGCGGPSPRGHTHRWHLPWTRLSSGAATRWVPGTKIVWKNYKGKSHLLMARCPGVLICSLRENAS